MIFHTVTSKVANMSHCVSKMSKILEINFVFRAKGVKTRPDN